MLRIFCVMIALILALPGNAAAQSAKDVFDLILRNTQQAARVPPVQRQAPPASANILEMQRLLNSAGFIAGTPDGMAGPATVRAIVEFQRSHGFTPTGQLTVQQLAMLRSSAKPKVATPNVDIQSVQSGLTNLGFDPGPVDGQWGRRSQTALDNFRLSRGIGRQGPATPADLATLLGNGSADEQQAALPSSGVDTELPAIALPPDLRTAGSGVEVLYSLPVVDGGQDFWIAWEGASGGEDWIAILPAGTAPTPGNPAWQMGDRQKTPISAPEAPGLYDIVWIASIDGSILLRRPLEVR